MRTETISNWVPWVLLATAAAALGTAYVAQLGFGYEPCVLCLYQRVPYAVIAVLGVVAIFVTPAAQRRWIAALAALTFAVGAGIAFYHVGVEQTWWTSVAPCGGSELAISNTEDFLAALQRKPEKSCGDIDWTLFGVSMATYNAVISALLALLSVWAWRQLGRHKG